MDADLGGFRAIQRTRAFEQIVGQFRTLITSGSLQPGARLPSERELATMFGVSRAVVREALRSLEALGILQVRSGHGTFIQAASIPTALPPEPGRTAQSDRDVFEARLILEPQLAALASERATPEDVRNLRGIVEQQAAEVHAGRSGTEADFAFHAAIYRTAGNAALQTFMDGLADRARRLRAIARQMPGRGTASLAEHRAILAAIEAHDAKAAEQRMEEHVVTMQQMFLAARVWTQPPASP